jgi:hypothetical protein
MNTPAIRLEGGLFGPDLFDQLLSADLPGQQPADFGLDARRSLTDEIAAVFSEARALWAVFKQRLDRVPETDVATTVTRDAWVIPFLSALGYELTYNVRAYEIDGHTFALSHRAGGHDAAPPVHIVGARQPLGRVAASGRPRMAPHSLLQDFLNRTEHVWGIVTNGTTLRLLRDSTFVRRQSYLEFDLAAILDEQRFQDFAVLYRLLHRTRVSRVASDVDDFLLERYYARAQEQGGRVRDRLRDGVERCIEVLANGFLAHPGNARLREEVSAPDLYRQLLRLVYRLLFLLVSEERGLLPGTDVYRDHYGAARLRRLVERHRHVAFTGHDDVWESLRVLWRTLRDDELAPFLGLPVLNGELFDPVVLDESAIPNRDFLSGVWHLTWYQDKHVQRRVNYSALDVEELGSVYESLLESHPVIEVQGERRTFVLVAGSERKETGSYYTPPELVNELVLSALDPVIADRMKAPAAAREQALLSIRVCDPACGSGHFLLAAARRIGRALARVRSGEEEPSPEAAREATRDVIGHCIYGVDKNPLAVDLCRVALWLESHTGDRPLTFLDHRIRCGDSLVGVFSLEALKAGIPDEAFTPFEDDDRETARVVKRRNKQERLGNRTFWEEHAIQPPAEFGARSRELDGIADDSAEAIRRKKRLFESAHAEANWLRWEAACNLWTAAFFQRLRAGEPVITTAAVAEHLAGRGIDSRLSGRAFALAVEHRFFHWPLEFPEVFADGGFDVVLSNPPWERVKLQEQEFFASRDARIASAPNKAARAALIRKLPEDNQTLAAEFQRALRAASGISAFLRTSERYLLTGRGDINTYAVFAELGSGLIGTRGRAGLLLPTGIATDDTTKAFFDNVVQSGRLTTLIGYENEALIFPAVHHAFKFCQFVISSSHRGGARLAFFIRRFSQLQETERFFQLSPDEFLLLSPNTGNCPIFRTARDAQLTKGIYRRVPPIWIESKPGRPEQNPWRLSFGTLFHMANDSEDFRTADKLRQAGCELQANVWTDGQRRYLPLYEAKMVHQFDHRYGTYEGATQEQLNVGILPQPTSEQKQDPTFVIQPRYWVEEALVDAAIPRFPEPLAEAVKLEDNDSIRYVIALWYGGYLFATGRASEATDWLAWQIARYECDPKVARALGEFGTEQHEQAQGLQDVYPLPAELDVENQISDDEAIARMSSELLHQFSPRWLLGWRDIARATDERTWIASALPRTAIGHTFPLMFVRSEPAQRGLALLGNCNAHVTDYVARQKAGGTHLTYHIVRQLTAPSPNRFLNSDGWWHSRLVELIFTATDLSAIGDEWNCREPFTWDDERRFQIRCELDAAFFHLYLPASDDGTWQRARVSDGHVVDETEEQLAALTAHFPTPRHAVLHIMDSFPLVKKKDEEAHGSFRTKDRILEIYDEMLDARRRGIEWQSPLQPPPGRRN